MFSAQRYVPCGYQQLSSPAAATNLTLPGKGETVAIIKTSTQACRWRDDGTPPTASIGVPMLTSDPPFEYSGNLSTFQIIQQTAGAIVDIVYYKAVG